MPYRHKQVVRSAGTLKRTALDSRVGGLHVRAIDLAAAYQKWVNRPARTDNNSRAFEGACFRLIDVVDAVGAIEYTAANIARIAAKLRPSARKVFAPFKDLSASDLMIERVNLFNKGLDAYYEFHNLLWWTRALDDRIAKTDFGLINFVDDEERATIKGHRRSLLGLPAMRNIRALADYTAFVGHPSSNRTRVQLSQRPASDPRSRYLYE